MTVKVTTPTGEPRQGVEVNFEIVEGTGIIIDTQSITDENGFATSGFVAGSVSFILAFEQATIRATSAVGSVEFKMTSYGVDDDDAVGPIIENLTPFTVNLGQGDLVEAAVSAKIVAGDFPQIGVPIPNVGLRITDAFITDLDGPAVCEGLSRSDNLGVARCNVRAACQLGTFPAQISVGEYRFYPVIFRIGPGHAAKLTISSGDEQTGVAGGALANPLVAVVTDNCGQAVSGVTVTWTVIQGTATLAQVVSVSDAGGRVSARVNLGATPGPIQVRVSMPNAPAVIFDATNQVLISGISLVSGGGQAVRQGQAFPNPIIFVVRNAQSNPVPGVVVNFSLSGTGTLGSTQATSDANGRVQTTVTAGNTVGALTVTATYTTFTATANLTVQASGPVLTSASFFNAASGAAGLVPCGLATATGNGLAPNLSGVVSGISPFGPLSYTLNWATGNSINITVNNISAPLQSVANVNGAQQVTFQTPCETTVGSAQVVVTVNGATTAVNGVAVFAGQPGIFTYQGPQNKVYGAVIRALDGSYVTPTNQARRGERHLLVLTGLGQTTPPTSTNAAGIPGQNVNLQVLVGVNNVGVPVEKAEYLPGFIGVYIVTFTIPSSAQVGTDQPLAVAVILNGQAVFGNSVLLPGVSQ
jgi:uncharacterized protein (TIGR03437 family)